MIQILAIPIYIIYALIVVAFAIFSYFGLSNLNQFGYEGDATRKMIMIYSIIGTSILIFSIIGIFFLR